MTFTEEQSRKLLDLVNQAARIFKSEPTDAAEFVDNANTILVTWELANEIKNEIQLDD